MELEALSNRLIGLAIEVHRTVGPGLLESAYRAFLCMELEEANIPFQSEAMVPVHYKGRAAPLGFRADIVVADSIIVEIKAVAAFVPAPWLLVVLVVKNAVHQSGLSSPGSRTAQPAASAGSDRHVPRERDPVHLPPEAVVVVDRGVQRAAVVP